MSKAKEQFNCDTDPFVYEDLMSYGDPLLNSQIAARAVSKEPQLALNMDDYNTILENKLTDEIVNNEYSNFYGNVITNHAILQWDIKRWMLMFQFDNWQPITIKFKQELWWSRIYINLAIKKYCDERDINYYYVFERGENANLHFHGLFGFSNEQTRKRFQVWINKYFGKMHTSNKIGPHGDMEWFKYVHKTIMYECPEWVKEMITLYTVSNDFEGFTP